MLQVKLVWYPKWLHVQHLSELFFLPLFHEIFLYRNFSNLNSVFRSLALIKLLFFLFQFLLVFFLLPFSIIRQKFYAAGWELGGCIWMSRQWEGNVKRSFELPNSEMGKNGNREGGERGTAWQRTQTRSMDGLLLNWKVFLNYKGYLPRYQSVISSRSFKGRTWK